MINRANNVKSNEKDNLFTLISAPFCTKDSNKKSLVVFQPLLPNATLSWKQ